jgi:(1->4)-alpha-D-glucan 1-alpha-D-glucosylmutase
VTRLPPVPSSTYRLHLRPGFGLREAAELVPYLSELGVSHLYLSPILQAAAESSGYGTIDPDRVDEGLGGEPAFTLLVEALRQAGLGLVLDIVPNHMAAAPANPRWEDVLARGRESPYASWFDIWWEESRPGRLRYRRFFDIDQLVGLRQEDEAVFRGTHGRLLEWVRSGLVQGLRVDHPDGLRDPRGYFERLRAAAPGAWIVAEKILSRGERLAENWPVAGTTGYDFMNLALGLLVDPAGEERLTSLWQRFSGQTQNFPAVAYLSRHQFLAQALVHEVEHLVRLAGGDQPDATAKALREYMACLPVYRTYLRPGEEPSEADRRVIENAVGAARANRPDLDPDLFELPWSDGLGPSLQQLSGAAMAKGVEDTAFYRYNRLVALNEVGGDPGRFSVSVDDFHAWCCEMAARWPARMNSTSTHDTKRGEDVRARLAALSELPEEWEAAVFDWSETAGPFADPSLQYLLFQTMVGAHPLSEARALAYLLKAAREAKTSTSWTEPDAEFEAELAGLVRRVLPAAGDLAVRLAEPGWRNSLSLKLLCLTAPGVPDVYQGGELWDLSLVDPDNRGPVDFPLRARLLAESEQLAAGSAWARAGEGLPKLRLVYSALRLRRQRPDLYGPEAAYEPLAVSGARAGHLVAYLRGGGAVSLAPRLVVGVGVSWGDTTVELPAGLWRDQLTGVPVEGGRQRAADLLAGFPVGLLVRES